MADEKDKPSVKDRLGERVDIHDLPTDQLKHTGLGSLPYPGQHDPKEGTQYTMPTGPVSGAKGPIPVANPDDYLGTPFKPATPPKPATSQTQAPQQEQPVDGQEAKNNFETLRRSLAGLTQAIPSMGESDTIKQLRRKFGVSTVEMEHIELSGFKWSFRAVGQTDVSWAFVLMSEFMQSEQQVSMLFGSAMVCVSCCAIDDKPVYEHFGLDVGSTHIRDPMFPPRSIRFRASAMLFNMLADELYDPLIEALAGFYREKISDKIDREVRGPLARNSPSSTLSSTTQSSISDTSSPG